jgi:pilus assembly protein Flp/PilA
MRTGPGAGAAVCRRTCDLRAGIQPRREVNGIVFVSKLSAVATRITHDDREGQGLAEYALILALIAIVAIVALLYLGGQISERLSQVGNAM